MRAVDRPAWQAKTLRLNAGKTIAAGDRTQDLYARKGLVTEITQPVGPGDVVDHGGITVRLDDGTDDHYPLFGWDRLLRILSR